MNTVFKSDIDESSLEDSYLYNWKSREWVCRRDHTCAIARTTSSIPGSSSLNIQSSHIYPRGLRGKVAGSSLLTISGGGYGLALELVSVEEV